MPPEPLRTDGGAPAERGPEARDATAQEFPEQSSELELSPDSGDADDDVHFGVAAKALAVSRKTIERKVKRGQLERGPSGGSAVVSKRSLVAALEERRGDAGALAPAAAFESGEELVEHAPWSPAEAGLELQQALRPVLEPLLQELVASRTRAEVLERHVDSFAGRAAYEHRRDELLVALATGSWRERRRARRFALRHLLRGDRFPPAGS